MRFALFLRYVRFVSWLRVVSWSRLSRLRQSWILTRPICSPHRSRPLASFCLFPRSPLPSRSKEVRKSIARVLTVISQTQRKALRRYYENKKYLPLDLRPKKTRAIRRRLTKHELSLKTTKRIKKDAAFPKRKYAVTA